MQTKNANEKTADTAYGLTNLAPLPAEATSKNSAQERMYLVNPTTWFMPSNVILAASIT